jgi:energy-coupling factor transport system permease protein
MGITSESELVEGMRKLRMPYVICFIFMLAIRFFPTLASDLTMIREAQMSRGTNFEKGSLLERGRKLAAVLIPLMVVSFKRVEVISTGLEARAFNPFGMSKRTYFRQTPTRLRDIILITIALAAIVGVFAYDLSQGLAISGGVGITAG